MLLFSAGTPMLLGGDELLRTQGGNNNAYCQDNPITWFDWARRRAERGLVAFFQKAIAFTKKYTILQRRKFFAGTDRDGNAVPDIQWFGEDLGALPAGTIRRRGSCATSSTGARSRRWRDRTSSSSP